jgi:hypothetical protein
MSRPMRAIAASMRRFVLGRPGLLGGTLVAIGTLTLGHAAVATPSTRQAPAGLRANWQDLETWSHYLDTSRQDELGLGFQLTGQGGTALVAFLGRVDVRAPRQPPPQLSVQAGMSARANPNSLRTPVLTFVLDGGMETRTVVDLSPGLRVDNPAPGAHFDNGLAGLRAADLVRMTDAHTIDANVFGVQVSFRPDQIQALSAFAERLHLMRKIDRRLH